MAKAEYVDSETQRKLLEKNFEAGRKVALNDESYESDLEIAEAIGSFYNDPANTDFQRGYLAGLKERFVAMQKGKLS